MLCSICLSEATSGDRTGAMGFGVQNHKRRTTMMRKSFFKSLLILSLTIILAYSALHAWADQAAASKAGTHKVIAYYFHTNTRCSTCMKIEAYSREAIEKGFPEELKNGILEMRIVNYEQPENRHFIKEYKLVSKSLILVNTVNDKQAEWTNLKMVWQLTGRKDAFLNYVRREVRSYLAKD
jgi:hypothetical protein